MHEAEYGYSPLFLWKEPKQVPEYRHAEMRDFQTGWGIADYQQQATIGGLVTAKAEGLTRLWKFFLCGALWVPLLMLRPLLGQQRMRFVWLTLVIVLAGEMAVPWTYPHYFAPVVPLVFVLVVQGMRCLATLPRWGYGWARLAIPAVVLLHVAAIPSLFADYVTQQPSTWQWHRARLAQQLESLPGNHLVMVHYRPDHNYHAEWVYNGADIAGSKVIWARRIDDRRDTQLLRFFQHRHVWLIDADAEYPKLIAIVTDDDGETMEPLALAYD